MAAGKKTCGRRKGSKNRATIVQELRVKARVEAAMEAGITPLEFMLDVMRDETKPFPERYAAARDAAPYQHAKLASVQHSGDTENPVAYQIMSGVTRQDDTADDDADRPNTAH